MRSSIFKFLSPILILLPSCLLSSCTPSATLAKTEQTPASFDSYMNDLFCSEVAQNTINLHFTLKSPEDFGVSDVPVTLGSPSKEAALKSASDTENTLSALESFPYSSLSKDQQLTMDVLTDYLHTQLALSDYALYDEILKPSTGIQAQLPILYEEYKFNDRADIEDYLTLLSLTDTYFSEIITVEQQKSDAGLFMSDYACNTIIAQCEDFIADTQHHYLIETFDKKIDQFQNLTDSERAEYKTRNLTLLQEHVFPAYQKLAEALKTLLGSGKNDKGLCYLDKGAEYYKNLLYYNTGCSMDITELKEAIEKQRLADLTEAASLCTLDKTLWETCQNTSLTGMDSVTTLNILQSQMQTQFPKAPDTDFTVSYIDECMEEYVAPAFYITAPIDDPKHHSIYINASTDATSMRYFTTLAHEGFPGHLYQTVMSYEAGLPPIRFLLNYPGYVEGWATYVEMISYSYAGLEESVAKLLSLNQSALLSLYATTDIGIHYDGWDFSKMQSFWNDYGITNRDALKEIYELIVEEPAHYLKYYAGYLEFLHLRREAQETYGDNYCDLSFHQAILSIGPAPFDILRKYLPYYYKTEN